MLTEADAENSETSIRLDFALSYKYLKEEKHLYLTNLGIEVGKLINNRISNPKKLGLKCIN